MNGNEIVKEITKRLDERIDGLEKQLDDFKKDFVKHDDKWRPIREDVNNNSTSLKWITWFIRIMVFSFITGFFFFIKG